MHERGRSDPARELPSPLDPARAQLVIVDVQEAFRGRIACFDAIARRAAFLVRVARILGVPVVACEQNPGRLGPSALEVVEALEGAQPISKLSFDATQDGEFAARLDPRRSQVIVAGIEAHVCVLQTALGLVRRGFETALVLDAIGSQREGDAETAIRRALAAGAVACSAEAIAFELVGTAAHPRFRDVLDLVVAGLEADRAGGR